MKYGCFGSLSDLPDIAAAGFSSVELGIDEIDELSEEELEKLSEFLTAHQMDCKIFSRIMPLNLSILSEEFDQSYWLNRYAVLARKTARLGAEAWVFGCGKPRSLGKGPDREGRAAKIDEFISKTAEVLGREGLMLIIEPLGPAYSDYLQTIEEVQACVRRLSSGNLSAMCDLRHMAATGEPLSNISKFAGYIAHAHIDYPLGSKRFFPKENDGFDYRPYLQALRDIGYRGLLTVEAVHFKSLAEEGRDSLFYLQTL